SQGLGPRAGDRPGHSRLAARIHARLGGAAPGLRAAHARPRGRAPDLPHARPGHPSGRRRDRAADAARGDRHRGAAALWSGPIPRRRAPRLAARPVARARPPPRGRPDAAPMINTFAQIDHLASAGQSPWHRASALAKLILAVVYVGLAVATPSWGVLAGLLLPLLVICAGARVPGPPVLPAAPPPLLVSGLLLP